MNNPYNHYPINDVDSDFYDLPGVVGGNSSNNNHNNNNNYNNTNNLVPHQSPRPHHELTNDTAYTNFPEEPNSYLLENLNKQGYPQNTSLHNLPHPNQPHNGSFVSNFYHGYSNDSQSFAVEDIDNFQPFPVAGDSYALNTYQDDSDSYSEEEDLNTYFPNNTPRPTIAGVYNNPTPVLKDDDDTLPVDQTQPPPEIPDQFLNVDQHVIPPPEDHQARRVTNTKKVKLFRGNLVLDCPVPRQFLNSFNPEDVKEREFTHMRYSAATCDPDQFVEQNFLLRQKCYRQPRSTELLIAITVYNEDDILLGRTLAGVFKNIKHLVMRNNTSVWGQEAWKKVVVCVIADGRSKMDHRAKGLMARLGVYQEGLAKNLVADRPVHAHIYEYTTMAGIKSVDKTVNFTSNKTVPVQMIFCMKEKNQKKINSHRWFFNAFGRILQPKVCILLDAGTQPAHDSIYHLWKSFDSNPRIGGACGEIRAGLGKAGTKLLNPLVAAQNFEYKMSNILDKPMESMFGFITVLPGAFSAYRYEALQNNDLDEGPLNKYFKGETLHNSQAGLFTANMYLAEDRILCFELVAKRNSSWLLKYVKSAHAVTDVPETLSELVLQRRRWLNGSFFAAIYSLTHVHHLWKSSHSFLRKLILVIEFIYQLISILFSWFSIGNFFLVFRILTNSLGDPAMGFSPGKILGTVFLWLYCACIVSIFVLSFGNRPKGTQAFYIIVVIFFAVLMAYLLFAAIFISVKSVAYTLCINDNKLTVSLVFGNELFRDLVVSLMSTYALYFVSSFLFFEPWHMFTSFLQYLLISPSYINVLNVYAFCNIHDISWGTKGDTGQSLDLGIAKLDDSNKQHIQVAIPHHLKDIDENYIKYVNLLNMPKSSTESEEKVSEQEKEKDFYALIRSSVVLLWMFTNFIIIAIVLNTAGLNAITESDPSTQAAAGTSTTTAITNLLARSNIESVSTYITELTELVKRQVSPSENNSCGSIGSGGTVRTEIYLTVVLWCVAALAAFRFVGAVLYLVLRVFGY